MLRSALLWASTNPFLARRLPRYGFVRRATRRFMPGETMDDALRAAEGLRCQGASTTFTLLGEDVTTGAEANAVADHYLRILDAVRDRGLDAEVSLKPTQLGLELGLDGARRRLERIVEASGPERLVWLDMESSPHAEPTLEMFRSVRRDHAGVGLCLQAYLRRTEGDLEGLLPLSPAIRLVKGAYREPPAVAFPRKVDVDRSFARLATTLLEARKAGRAGRVVLGTHDPRIVAEAGDLARKLGLGPGHWETAMLFGIRIGEQARLLREGVPLRVLISYGTEWFPWYMRRLAERPANLWFVLTQVGRPW